MKKKEKQQFMTSLEELLFKNGKNPNGKTLDRNAKKTLRRLKKKKPKQLNISSTLADKIAKDFSKRKLGMQNTLTREGMGALRRSTEEEPVQITQTAWELFKAQYKDGLGGQRTLNRRRSDDDESEKAEAKITQQEEHKVEEEKAEAFFVESGIPQTGEKAEAFYVETGVPEQVVSGTGNFQQDPQIKSGDGVEKEALIQNTVKELERFTKEMDKIKRTRKSIRSAELEDKDSERLTENANLKPSTEESLPKGEISKEKLETPRNVESTGDQKTLRQDEEGEYTKAAQQKKDDEDENLPLQKLDKEIFDEINKVRLDPSSYIPYLEEILEKDEYDRTAVEDAIQALEMKESVVSVGWSDNLAKAAKLHVDSAGETGDFSHLGKGDSTPVDRIKSVEPDIGAFSSLLHFGPTLRARDIVLGLIIDESDDMRRSRKSIFNFWDKFGCTTGPHKSSKYMTTLHFAQTKETSKQLLDLAVSAWQESIDEPAGFSPENPTGWIKKEQEVRQHQGIITIVNKYIYKDDEPDIIEATISHYRD